MAKMSNLGADLYLVLRIWTWRIHGIRV